MVGTFLCGPEALAQVLEKKCAKYSEVDPRKTKFYFNKENFWRPTPAHQETGKSRFPVLEKSKHPQSLASTITVSPSKITERPFKVQELKGQRGSTVEEARF